MLTRIVDKDLYNAPRFKLQKVVFNRNRAFFENKLTELFGKPNNLWNPLKSLESPNKISS